MRVCLESGSISHWLARGLIKVGFGVIVAEARHLERFLSARTNKNDNNDAIRIAEALRAGLVEPVAVKSETAQAQQVLLGSRRQLQQTGRTLANGVRGVRLHQSLPGVGPVTSMTFISAIDNPQRFHDSRIIGAYLGLSPRQYASRDINHIGRISKRGHGECRSMLYEAALSILTRCKQPSKLQSWGKQLMKKKGTKKAAIAVARKLATIMHRMLMTGELFDPSHTVRA